MLPCFRFSPGGPRTARPAQALQSSDRRAPRTGTGRYWDTGGNSSKSPISGEMPTESKKTWAIQRDDAQASRLLIVLERCRCGDGRLIDSERNFIWICEFRDRQGGRRKGGSSRLERGEGLLTMAPSREEELPDRQRHGQLLRSIDLLVSHRTSSFARGCTADHRVERERHRRSIDSRLCHRVLYSRRYVLDMVLARQ